MDETTLPALKDAALGQYEARFWASDMKVPASERFVADFRKKYGYTPSFYGAQSYDGVNLIESALRAVKGDVNDVKGMVAAMRKADFPSIRGPFKYNVNHHPIQDFYLLRATKSADGSVHTTIQKKIFDDHRDSYYKDCKMKW